MTRLRTPLAAAALLGALAGSAIAQTPPPAAPAPAASGSSMQRHDRGLQDMARWQQRHERHLADLKQSLQLTPAQAPAWDAFAAAMKPPATPPQRPDRDALARMTTPERLDQMRALHQQRLAEMDRRAEATKAFYAQLSPEQKKRLDQHTDRMLSHGRRGFHGHHGPEGHAPYGR